MNKVDFLRNFNFPDQWLSLGTYPDELHQLQNTASSARPNSHRLQAIAPL
jgi:hypothetical protein